MIEVAGALDDVGDAIAISVSGGGGRRGRHTEGATEQ
jgi:hypothetical protein